jgi:hypothetical protein
VGSDWARGSGSGFVDEFRAREDGGDAIDTSGAGSFCIGEVIEIDGFVDWIFIGGRSA